MISNKEIGSRIYDVRTSRNLTLDQIASRVGVAKSTISRYEKGTIDKLKLPVIQSIASCLGVNPNWLIGNVADPSPIPAPGNIVPLPRMGSVPLVGDIACGEPILAAENVAEYVDLPEHIRADFALRCKGDSMINARIYDGDIVYIRQQPTVEDGQIAAVLVGDEATLKRVRFFPDHIVLEAENPNVRPFVYWEDEMNDLHILGLAVAFTSAVF